MNAFWLKVCMAGAVALGMAGAAQAVPSTFPTGTVKYDPSRAYNGYLLIGNGTPRLVDMNGNLVKEWFGFNGMPNKALRGGRILTGTGTWKDGQQDTLALIELDSGGEQAVGIPQRPADARHSRPALRRRKDMDRPPAP